MWVAAKISMPKCCLISSPYLKVQDQLWSVAKRQEIFQDASGKSRKHSLEKVLTQIHNHQPFLFSNGGNPQGCPPDEPLAAQVITARDITNHQQSTDSLSNQMDSNARIQAFSALWISLVVLT